MSKTDVLPSTEAFLHAKAPPIGGVFFAPGVGASMTARAFNKWPGMQPMSKYIFLPLVLSVLVGPAFATFEIKDPAAELYADQPQDPLAALAQKTCVQFLLDGVEKPTDYWTVINTVNAASGEEHTALSTEMALKSWCIDHAKHDLLQAAAATGFIKPE
jgi:hypothetical protein